MPLCQFYRSRRGCLYGDYCRNEHSRICQFFLTHGGCKFGDSCLFEHEIRRKAIPETNEHATSQPNLRSAVNTATLTAETALKYRKADMEILLMKYPNAVVIDDFTIRIDFSCSDPDWPFAVNEIALEIHFPELYPAKVLSVVCAPSSILPQPVIRFGPRFRRMFCLVNESITDYLGDKQKSIDESCFSVLMVRPFLRWLDREIINFFHRGLTQAKLNCTVEVANSKTQRSTAEHYDQDKIDNGCKLPEVFVTYRKTDESQSIETVREKLESMKHISNEGASSSNPQDSEYEYSSSSEESDTADLGASNEGAASLDTKRSGIELVLIGFAFLSSSMCTITCRKFACLFRCLRCSSQYELVLDPSSAISRQCSKCRKHLIVNFRPTILHQNSETLGYLDTENAVPVDVNAVESQWAIMCSSCNSTTATPGVNAGESKLVFCHQCHQKYEMQFKATKFKDLMIKTDIPPELVKVTKAKKREKDVINLVVGEPLPKRGTCKHYRKSYRWLRFPCCGRAYPCDICHNDVETHECEFANRMICGFCSKEQGYQKEKSCTGCSNQLAGTTGSHWEGGRGCRNQKKMNKNDRQKYRNRNKTVAKKNVASNKTS